MAFLDDFDRKLTEYGRGVMKKTKEASDNFKISSAIRSLENKRKDLLIELGESFLSSYRDMARGSEAEIIRQIEQVEREIRSNQEMMERNGRSVMFCPNCHAEIPAGSRFCNVCGQKIEQPMAGSQMGGAGTCTRCGGPLQPGQVFCTNCGMRVQEAAPEPAPERLQQSAVYEMPPAEEPLQREEPAAEKEDSVLEAEPIREEAVFPEEADPVPDAEPETVKELVEEPVLCPNCGAAVGQGQSFCTQCGTKIRQ